MKSQDFQLLVEQLNELSTAQRTALVAALRSKGSNNEALALIETRFAADPCCGHCGSRCFGPWGRANALRRYKCKDCGRTFNALTGTPLAQLHRRDAWLDYARALVERVSLRSAAARASISLDTSFRWRHRFLMTAKDKRPSVLAGIVEADETLIRKSSKGSRSLVGGVAGLKRREHRLTTTTLSLSLAIGRKPPATKFSPALNLTRSTRRSIRSPVVKLTAPWNATIWLLTEMAPDDPGRLFGLKTVHDGSAELAYFRISSLESLAGPDGDACPSAMKMLRSGLLSPGQCRAPTLFGRHHDTQHLAEIIPHRCQHGSPMTKATSKSP